MMKIFLTFGLSLAFLSSCAPKSPSSGLLETVTSYIFSNRQQTPTSYVGIVQLKLPALLKDAKIENGKAVVDEDLKAAILAEQEEVIARLGEISSEIKIIAKYRMVINALAFVAPMDLISKIEKVEGVSIMVQNTNFERPKTMSSKLNVKNLLTDLNKKNTVTFIGADKAHEIGHRGRGMKVGIIDTGIDFTHKMFGGPGTEAAYQSVNPDEKTEFFPNNKVVGGVDFVGTDFNAASDKVEFQIPKRDLNPIDEAEHGSHVAGTVAGIGDGTNTYSGVAPDAELFGLKVFGKKGSTSDIAVIQALEFAADTTESMNPSMKLDVVNLSLGGGFGKPKILYNEAISNLTHGGTVVVASAGNSGDTPYITGAPATSDAAISIAASIDDLDQNILSDAIEFKIDDKTIIHELVEGDLSTPAKASNLSGELVYIGNGADPISDEQALKVAGKIALMDRGAISFVQKFEKAVSLKAVGVVMVNNQDSKPIAMGGDKKFNIPGVMITKALGTAIKSELQKKNVVVNFNSNEIIKHDELIDQITDFSSRGPRSLDSLIKPEIAAPGSNIISALSGSGDKPLMISGTSMSAPHMAGVMTLLKEAFPKLSVLELKTLVMNTSKIMTSPKGDYLPVSRQGAGRVQVLEALNSKFLAMPASLSLGEISISKNKSVFKEVRIKNLSNEDLIITTKSLKGKNVEVNLPAAIRVKANSIQKIRVSFVLKMSNDEQNNIESDGFVILKDQKGGVVHLPFLAVLNRVSDMKASNLVTQTDSLVDRFGSEVKLDIKNNGTNDGEALIFNLLGKDDRKKVLNPTNLSANTSCDLEAAGIRVIERESEGKAIKLLQIGVKLYDTLSIWQPCDISLQIDNNRDGITDQELVGIRANYISGINANQIASILLDAGLTRQIRSAFELDSANNEENYVPAIMDVQEMKFYDHGSVAVIETDLSKVIKGKDDLVGIKISVSNLESSDSTGDDFLASHETKWHEIFLNEDSFAFTEIPEVIKVKAQDQEAISMKRGVGDQRLLVLFPFNMSLNNLIHDNEIQVLDEILLK